MATGIAVLAPGPVRIKLHIIVGAGAGILLLAVYAGVIITAQGWAHFLEQTSRLWYWIALLAIGFGIQAGLYSFIRKSLKERKASAGIGASGGVSAGAMVACCAHHLGDVLPFMGIAGAAAFVVEYQAFFLLLGVLSNIVGVSLMLETIQRHGLSPMVAGWKWDMRRAARGVIVSAVIILIAFGIALAF